MTYLGEGFNPNTPTFQAAELACRKYSVGLATRVTAAGAAQLETEQLEYAGACVSMGCPTSPIPVQTADSRSRVRSTRTARSFWSRRVAVRTCYLVGPAHPASVEAEVDDDRRRLLGSTTTIALSVKFSDPDTRARGLGSDGDGLN